MYLFRAKTKEAFVFKVLGELLSSTLKFSPFRITENGIYLRQTDIKREQLIDLFFNKDNFIVYKFTQPMNFTVNAMNLYKMLKNIKKKDSVTIFIEESNPEKLGISVEHQDENNKICTYLKILHSHNMENLDLPDGYGKPLIMNSKEFQKMKNMHSISKNILVKSSSSFISFFCDGGELYSREICIGERNEDENINYEQNFFTQHLTILTKCAGLAGNGSGNIYIYTHEDLPLKINISLGNIGELHVYIKSLEMIEEENIDKENN